MVLGTTDPLKFPNPGFRLTITGPGFLPLIPGTFTIDTVNGLHDSNGTTGSVDMVIEKLPGCTNVNPSGTVTVKQALYDFKAIPAFRGPVIVFHPLAFDMHFEFKCTSKDGLFVGDFSMTDTALLDAKPFDPATVAGTGGGTGSGGTGSGGTGSGGTGSGGTGSGGTGSGGGNPTPLGPTVVLTDSVIASPVLMANAASVDVPFSTFIPSTVTGDVTLSAATDADNLLASISPSVIKPGGTGDAVLTLRTTATTRAGDHPVTITASDGVNPSSATFFVTVLCDPPFILGLNQPKIDVGKPAVLTVKASGSGPFTYQWFTGASGLVNFPVAGATSATYTTGALNDTTAYWVRVTNACGSVDSQTVTVIVGNKANRFYRR